MADALICDRCGQHKPRANALGWVEIRAVPAESSGAFVSTIRGRSTSPLSMEGHYCSAVCVANRAIEVTEAIDRLRSTGNGA